MARRGVTIALKMRREQCIPVTNLQVCPPDLHIEHEPTVDIPPRVVRRRATKKTAKRCRR